MTPKHKLRCENVVVYVAFIAPPCCVATPVIFLIMGVEKPVKYNAILCNSHAINNLSQLPF